LKRTQPTIIVYDSAKEEEVEKPNPQIGQTQLEILRHEQLLEVCKEEQRDLEEIAKKGDVRLEDERVVIHAPGGVEVRAASAVGKLPNGKTVDLFAWDDEAIGAYRVGIAEAELGVSRLDERLTALENNGVFRRIAVKPDESLTLSGAVRVEGYLEVAQGQATIDVWDEVQALGARLTRLEGRIAVVEAQASQAIGLVGSVANLRTALTRSRDWTEMQAFLRQTAPSSGGGGPIRRPVPPGSDPERS
jgi:hypothetical protein